jgi:hypothetical protein
MATCRADAKSKSLVLRPNDLYCLAGAFRVRTCFILLAVVVCSLPVCADSPIENPPGQEVSLPKNEVRDSFFAYILGIINTGSELDVDNKQMREILTEFKSSLHMPFGLIVRVRQTTDPSNGMRTIGLDFQHDVNIPIPFSLLFYHPGSIVASQNLVFTVTQSTLADPAAPAVTSPVFDLALTEGSVLVTIDGWLRVVMPAHHLEDTRIRHIVFFKWRGEWVGLFEGVLKKTAQEHRSYFNFTRNAIVFPVPNALDAIGRGIVSAAAK